ncbi:MAG: ligase [Bacillales bacterium]|jgi:bifunctional non-homologous end joining protein LigD|nr:ligase [Bacillales bacterium]
MKKGTKKYQIHPDLKITNPDKPLWKDPHYTKESYIAYLIQVAPLILPFLENRALTVIRYPHGIPGESFYQKNCPEYAPSFVHTEKIEDNNYILCNDLSTLIWLGNQSAIEFHVPFQTVESYKPVEIVIDLDPPNRDRFPLAIKAAQEIKVILDSFKIKGYPKLSGNKGIQIHIPLKGTSLSYDETRLFTGFIAEYLVEKFPNDFTIERLKKNRENRLYIDYIQHAEGKTIICPYSTRGNENATVATPLFWEEVNDSLKVDKYNISYVLKRISNKENPMDGFFSQENPTLINIVASLKEKQKNSGA